VFLDTSNTSAFAARLVPIAGHLETRQPGGEDGTVPETPDRAAAKVRARTAARRAARRREVANMLRIVECTARYGASQLGDGIGPEQAAEVALFVAGELEQVAAALRRAVPVGRGQRRSMAALMTGQGLTRVQVARRLGVSERTVHRDLGCP
jgi:hypothetical protein